MARCESCARLTTRPRRESRHRASRRAQTGRLRSGLTTTIHRSLVPQRTREIYRRPICDSVRRRRATHQYCNYCRGTASAPDARIQESFRRDDRLRVASDCRESPVRSASLPTHEVFPVTHRTRDRIFLDSGGDSRGLRDAESRHAVR